MKDWTIQKKEAAAILLAGLTLWSSPAAVVCSYGAQSTTGQIKNTAEDATESAQQVLISLSQAAQQKGSTWYVPLSDMAKAWGMEVTWNSQKQEVSAVSEDTSLRIEVGKPYAYINGVITLLPDSAYLSQGRTMVSVASLPALLSCEVTWNANTRELTLSASPEADLSYEAAAKAATRKNSSYYDLQDALSRVEDSNDRLYLSPGSYVPSQIQAKDALNLQEKWLEQQLGLAAQGIAVNVRSQMNQFQLKQEQLQLLQETKETLSYALQMEQLKYAHGVSSRLEWEAAQVKVTAIDAQIATCQAELQKSRLELSAMLGQNIEEDTTMELQLSYAPVTEEEKETVLRTQVSSDPYLWYAQEEWSQKDYRLRTYDYMTDYYGGGVSYPVAQLDLEAATHQVSQVRTQLVEAIEQRYAQLKEVEANIAELEVSVDDALRTIRSVQIQYEAGVATLNDCKQAQLQLPTLIYQIRALQLQHATLKTMFLQPYLQPSYVSGGQA